MRVLFAIILLGVTSSISFTAGAKSVVYKHSKSCVHDRDTFRCVNYVKNYDGDTITFFIDDTHPIVGDDITIRIRGVDTAEIHGADSCEKRVAAAAQKFVQNELYSARRIDLANISRGKYFRIVADLKFDGKDIAELLLKKGYAYKYDGGTKQEIDWCQRARQFNL